MDLEHRLDIAFTLFFDAVKTRGEASRNNHWTYGDFEADYVAPGPMGELCVLRGRDLSFAAYYRPSESGVGLMRRIDLRNITPERFLDLAAKIARPATTIPTVELPEEDADEPMSR